jgi:beta-glucosidase
VQDALSAGLISEADIDRNLRGVFRVMLRLGMLDPRGSVADQHIGFDAVAPMGRWTIHGGGRRTRRWRAR